MTARIVQRIRPLLSFETLFLLIVILAFFLRFFALDLKLFHHDESIHAWFAYDLLQKGAYVYDPMYHGPLLYYLTTGMFSLFGDSDLVARTLPALFGAAIVPLVYAIYRLGYLDKRQTLIASLFIAISPNLVYFSRFLRHDIFQLFFTVLILVALLAYLEKGTLRYALLAGLGIAGGMTLKEDMPLFLVVVVVFGLFLLWRKQIHLPPTWKRDLFFGILLAVGIMAVFYSSFGAHFEVLQTGWIKAYTHWTAMHGECRICGPWFFYILLFLLYEAPILLLAAFGVLQFFERHDPVPGCVAKIRSKIREIRTPATPIPETIPSAAAEWGASYTPASFDKRELFFLFCIVWMGATLAAYAYIGEKVPWLIIHQLLPMIFVGVYLMTPRKTVFALAGCIFLILMTWHVAFVPADINEPIVQVQNSEDMRTVMKLIDASDTVVLASKDYWPLPWYYRGDGWNKIKFYGQVIDESAVYDVDGDMVITHDLESYSSLTGYDKQTYRLAYWFSIYDNDKRLPEYYLKRDGKIGSLNIDVFTKPGL
ncbi:MAG: TIGR03663 family protein, partial [Methanolinea sp.]|nr:TIGR03663 family protein [Methanolinea sp.]